MVADAPDTADPTITLTGANPISVTAGTTYSDPGATCTDDTDTSPTLTTTSSVDTRTAGTYQVAYTCSDSSSNTATATRDVVVADAPDTADPTITLTGANPISVTAGTTYSDPGATCTDDTDTSPTLTTTSSVDTRTAGTYQVAYTCSDSSSNTATATRDVVVADAPDTADPTVSSIERHIPTDQNTGSQTLVYQVTFSENVTGVNTGDFALSPDSPVADGASGQFAQTSEPAIPITDRNTIQDIITVEQSGTAMSISVAVDITHSYIGDLKIDIIAPDGTTRTLHDRTGGSSDDIDQTYAPDFDGVGIAGDWTLRIRDGAGGDTGTLNGWTLTINHGSTASPITAVSGSGDTYQVTVLATQDGTYNLDLASSGHGIVDAASNPLADTTPTGADHTYTVSTAIADAADPVIAVSGDTQVTVQVDDTYADAGAGCVDNSDPDPTLVVDNSVNTSTAGTYTVTYTCTDASGNDATATRTVTVEAPVQDTAAPTVASITRSDPAVEVTNRTSLIFQVAFSENVTGVDVGDFALSPDSPVADGASGQFAQTSEPAIPITDRNTIQDIITVEQSGTAMSISVAVDITHSYIGDLKIDIIAPDGTTRTLHDRTGYEADDIDQTYAPDFDGVGIAGDWTLRIRDGAGGDTGTLNGWTLTINHGSTASPITAVSGSGDTYQVTVLATQDGTYNLDLASSGHGIVDAASNPLADTTPTGADHIYTVGTAAVN